MSPVLQGNQAKGDDDQEYSLFVNMPSEEERSVAAERYCSYEGIPCGLLEELDEWDYLEKKGESKAYSWSDFWEYCKRRIPN